MTRRGIGHRRMSRSALKSSDDVTVLSGGEASTLPSLMLSTFARVEESWKLGVKGTVGWLGSRVANPAVVLTEDVRLLFSLTQLCARISTRLAVSLAQARGKLVCSLRVHRSKGWVSTGVEGDVWKGDAEEEDCQKRGKLCL